MLDKVRIPIHMLFVYNSNPVHIQDEIEALKYSSVLVRFNASSLLDQKRKTVECGSSTYVTHIVSEICCLTSKQNWRYCSSPLSLIDMLSQGLNG